MTDNNEIVPQETLNAYNWLIAGTLAAIPSEKSKRVYKVTYKKWLEWCSTNKHNPVQFDDVAVGQFLDSQNVTRTTRKSMLVHLRRMSEYLAMHHNQFAPYHEQLKRVKVSNKAGGVERNKTALTPAQVDRTLRVWRDNDSPLNLRNRAIISTLFFTGMRRSELAEMQWSHIDFEAGTIFIPHGKGDKDRHVAIGGEENQDAVEVLLAWRHDLFTKSGEREFVWPNFRKGGHIGPDSPMTDQAVYLVVKDTEKIAGVKFSPHDARRTFITEADINGVPLREIQNQAGHANPQTTLNYVKVGDAQKRRGRIRLRYGGN